MSISAISDDDYGNNEVKDLLPLFLYEHLRHDDTFSPRFSKTDAYLSVNDESGMGCGKYPIIMHFSKRPLCSKCCLQ